MRFGIAADDAGSNGAEKIDRIASSGNASQIVSGPTSRNATQTTTRARSHAIMSFLRSIRSARAPAQGEAKKNASSWVRIASPTSIARPVASRIRPLIATNRNQSPPSEITDAKNSRRKSRLRRSNETLARTLPSAIVGGEGRV